MNKQEIKNKIEELEKKLSELKEKLNNSEKPKRGETYYYAFSSGEINCNLWCDAEIDIYRYSIGNCFKTREEAEFEIKRLEVIAELKRFADNNNNTLDWGDHIQPKFFIRYDFIQSKIITNFDTAIMNNCIYFSSIDIARRAIKEIGEDKIKKYYFGVKDEN